MSAPRGPRQFVARAGDRDRAIRIEPDGDGLRVRVDGEEFHVGVEESDAAESCLLLNGRPLVVNVGEEGDGRYRVMLGGGEVTVEILDPAMARASGGRRREGTGSERAGAGIGEDLEIELRAPMHGLVLAVQAREGETVEEEAPLVILEAMKMQNALTSPARARVREIKVREGETVEGETLLLVLERIGREGTEEPR
ncbi:MAG: biotin/lipoyl-containing protein [Candidatus Eisenbacteria bacterium]